jgi:uncharacterized protein (TIGR01777 family)
MAGKIFAVTGATGLVGKRLCKRLIERGDQVLILSRDPQAAKKKIPQAAGYLFFSPNQPLESQALEGITGVVHLAGAPLFGKRWDDAYKQEIMESRVQGTERIVTALGQLQNKPEVLVCASAVGYYGARDNTPLTEEASPGSDFLAQVCLAWEAAAAKVSALGIRRVSTRLGIVMDANEGALAKMLPPFQAFGGGPLGTGTQWFSWVHAEDVVGIMVWALDNPQVEGAVNATAPNPLQMADFCKTLGEVIQRPSWLPVPRFALELLLGEAAQVLVEGQKVIPQKATQGGYTFLYPTAERALKNLLG